MSDLIKTNKTPADFEGQEPSYEEKLEFYDTRKNHNKFWHIRVYGQFVVRHWGRHGSKGQTSVHRAYSEWNARQEADKLYWKKKDKGYVKDQTTVLDHIARRIG
jgi:predicted DNA-binding WGR domain protein